MSILMDDDGAMLFLLNRVITSRVILNSEFLTNALLRFQQYGQWRFVCKWIVLLVLTPGVAASGSLPATVDGVAVPSLAPMLEKVTPAVVNISTISRVTQSNGLMDDPFFRRFFDLPETPASKSRPQSLGSGVIVDAELGHIVTNYHVIANASEVLVALSDGREAKAVVIGHDPQADISLIKIELDNLVALPWADSDALRVGDFCIAIGNPFGLGQTVTSGIVSALDRSGLGIEDFEDFIQTDASINPGNSGGALVDLKGHLIGINTAIVGPSGGNVGIGFAIPSNMAVDILKQLLEFGEVKRGELGIAAQPLTPGLAKAFGINSRFGVVIGRIRQGSPAEKAGLQVGDVITSIDGKPVRDVRAIKNRIGLVMLGQELNMEVVREGKPILLTAIIEAIDQANAFFDGVQLVQEITRSGRVYVLIESIEPGSALDRAGLQAGDIILSINNQYVSSIDALDDQASRNADSVLLLVQRGQATDYVRVQK